MSKDAPTFGVPDEHRVLSGKRATPRHQRRLEAFCLGGDRWVAGHTVDVSAGGMLLEILEEGFAPESSDLVAFAATVAAEFPEGMEACLGEGAVHVRARVVRLVVRSGRPLLGCRFERHLVESEERALGLERAPVLAQSLADSTTSLESAAEDALVRNLLRA
jgi:hypothetical protein